MNQRFVAVLELLFATIIWGFGFTATIWAMESTSSIMISVGRFFGACLLTLPIFLISRDLRRHFNFANLKLSMLPGLFLGLTLILQTWGLEYTTATKSGFITTLYVILVPIFEILIIKKRVRLLHTLWVALALVGTGFIVQVQMNEVNKGDVLTLMCSVFAAAHIASLGVLGPKIQSPFVFNFYQSFWAGLLALAMLPFFAVSHWKGFNTLALIGFISLTVGSTMVAFALQVKAQKKISASLASLIFLLESPFAMLFGVLLLSEALTGYQALGATLIILAAAGAIRFEKKSI
jgi:drug/metabolite transporter (DMT)-like permease